MLRALGVMTLLFLSMNGMALTTKTIKLEKNKAQVVSGHTLKLTSFSHKAVLQGGPGAATAYIEDMKTHEILELRWDQDPEGKDSYGEAKLGDVRVVLRKMVYDAYVEVEILK